jgi:hypothetical protein
MACGIDREPPVTGESRGHPAGHQCSGAYRGLARPYVRALLIEVGADCEIPTQIWPELQPPPRRTRVRDDPECE